MDELEVYEHLYEPGMGRRGQYFIPTESELINGFLKKKIERRPLPNEIIKEIPFLYEYPPELLPIGKFKYARNNEAYYFTHKGKKPPNGEFLGGKKFDGEWKTEGLEEACFGQNQILGFKRKLYLYRCEKRTGWVIKEYRYNPKRVPDHYLQNSVFHDFLLNYVVLKIKFNPDLRENFTAEESFSISMEDAKDLDVFQDFEG
ncbi:PREDICTED: NAC domain-containing protein 76-like [Ipomoea nil]|uniref:NAC domain-containing protein 76-like n=1 Tax=Ipomoea nil TaxID=35883 RepID=UPI0009017B3B|nr:PREDICTED: NAC domain-containing protein 76-like isoform X2 [Ipomoea nil]XP_019161645.1 PREDICTED: NAC domain-containing protein 76-like [Ipomoea nil]